MGRARQWRLVATLLLVSVQGVHAAENGGLRPASSRLEAWLGGDGVTGDWFGWRSRLSDHGFDPFGTWTGEVFQNFDGGLKRATVWEGLLEFGVDLDLEKAFGWHGAHVHVSALWIQDDDDPSAVFVGNFDEVSNIAGKETVRFYEAYLRQDLMDETWSIKVGHLTLDQDFMVSDSAALFLNASFGALPVESVNTSAPIYPVAALGAWAQWTPEKDVTLQVGLYQGDTGTQNSNENGFDYHFGSREGVIVLAELGFDSALLGRDGSYKLGGYYHSGAFTDLDSGNTDWGNHAFYLVLDQVLVGTRDENQLAVFFRAGFSPKEDRNMVDWYLDAGLAARGLREKDRVGLGFSHAHFGSDFVSGQRLAGTPVTGAESVFELTYSAPVTPWLTVQPALQYVIDPQNKLASDAFLGALRATVNF